MGSCNYKMHQSTLFLLIVVVLQTSEVLSQNCKSAGVGASYYDGCKKFSCTKLNKKRVIWVESPAYDKCCNQAQMLHPPGTVLDVISSNDNCTLVKLICEEGPRITAKIEHDCVT